jgi:hypothetical protein
MRLAIKIMGFVTATVVSGVTLSPVGPAQAAR